MTKHDDQAERLPGTPEEKLTAQLMGELDEAGQAELEAALAADPALRARKAELESLLGTLRAAEPPAPALAADRRAELRQAAATVAAPSSPRSGLLRLPRAMKWAAVLLAVAGGAWWASEGALESLVDSSAAAPNAPASEASPPVDFGFSRELLEGLGYLSADDAEESSPGRKKMVDRRDRLGMGKNELESGIALQELAFAGSDASDSAVPPPADVKAERHEVQDQRFAKTGDSVLQLRGDLDLLETPADPFQGPGDSVPPGSAGGRFAEQEEPILWERWSSTAPAAPAAPLAPEARDVLDNALSRLSSGGSEADRDADGSAEGSLSFSGRARARKTRLGEDLDDFAASFRQGSRLIVIDGYGRRYHDQQVVEQYLCRQPRETPRDMFFRYYGDNPMVRAEEDSLSTFAADVDTASYPLARKYLAAGNLPPKAAIRTEEFVNYFDHGLAAPAEEDFALTIDYAPTPFSGEGAGIYRIGVKARELDRQSRKPLNLVFVIDRSGSMASGNRIELVKRSLELLVDQLRDDDTVGIVAFESSAHRILDPTPGYERYKIREAVRSLTTGGSTNAEAGLVMGYEMAERAFREEASNRVVLCSDGVANTGETDQGRILKRIRRFSERQIDLTAIGVGMGNHNDVFLERIADRGNGACHYVDDFEEAKRVFVERFTGTMQTIARDVKIQVEFNPGVIRRWRQLGYENRAIADADFRNDAVDAGEIGAGHELIGLYEAQGQAGPAIGDWAVKVRLRWFPDGSRVAEEKETVFKLGEGRSRFDLADARFRLGVVAAQYAEVLRRSYWARGDSYSDLVVEAEKLARDLPRDPQVRELRDMILLTRKLADRLLPPQDELAMLIDEARRLRLLEAEVEQVGGRSTELEARLGELRQRNEELEQQIRALLGG